mgnify:CR=1 FL=1
MTSGFIKLGIYDIICEMNKMSADENVIDIKTIFGVEVFVWGV